ncbi:hypothetical protein Y032_0006g2775 [Ancylostoma ceylanicum]|uniref:G-protein coupled receptors family 1 profile domain-containing protein n=2 Tax=Ancylostoma ceylanicum TaxID=53326 RepID=A0A016VNE5_9BILA|nr:hypothetical protein Y032_0006g2775 [Ancylostoma ceylanicum]
MIDSIAIAITPIMNNRSLTWENCKAMDDIANSVLLKAVLIVQTLSSTAAIPLLILLLRWVLTKSLMHFNTKFIFVFNIMCSLIHLLSRINQHVAGLCDYFHQRSDGCQIIPEIMYCFYVRLPYNCALWACYTTTFMIALERCIATIFLRSYHNNRTVGPLLVASQLMITSALLLFVYFPTRFSGVIMYYCLAMSAEKPMYTVIPLSLTMIIQSLAVLTFVKLNMVNKDIRLKLRNAGDLRGRYQVEETLRSLNTLSPFFYSSYAFIFTYLALMCTTLTVNHNFSTTLFLSVIEGERRSFKLVECG